MRNKKKKILSVLLIQLIIIASCASVFASSMINYNGSLHRLVLKSDKSKDFSSSSQVVGNDNGKGTIALETIDAEHGTSVVLKADNVDSYTTEGPWVQFDGDNTLDLLMYEFDLYLRELSGEIKFQVKANGSFDCLNINADGIGFGSTRTGFTVGQWNKIRMMFDRSGSNRKMYLYVNDAGPIEFTGGSLWRLGRGIEYVRMILVGATDAYVAADNFHLYEVKAMPSGYQTPALTLTAPSGITEREEARIEAEIGTNTPIENVKFYVNDSLIYTDAEAPYILEHLFAKGNHTIRAVATDEFGETGERTITITSLGDTRPKIEMFLENGKVYDRDILRNVSVSVSMSDASLASGKLYVDNIEKTSFTSAANTFDLSSLSLGVHTVKVYAENNLGESSEKSVQITVSKSSDDVIGTMNFNDGTVVGQLNGDGQFIRREVLRSDFKESLLVGANTTQDTSKQGAWIPINLNSTTSVAKVDFDIYFNGINGGGVVIQAMPKWVELFKITNQGIVAGGQTHPFAAERWYHMTIVLDAQGATFSIYLDNELIFDGLESSNMPQAIDSIRVISMLQGTEETYFAIDNIVARQVTKAASITKITSENGDTNVVSERDREIKVYFSGALQAASVYPAKFRLNGATIEKAVYDSEHFYVTLTLKDPLSAGTYRLETAENLVMSNGEIYAEKLYGDFSVKASVVEAQGLTVTGDTITTSIVNHSQDNKFAYMIINLYSGDVMKSSIVKGLVLVSGQNNIGERIDNYASGDVVEVFIWDSLKNPVCIMSTAD